MQPSRFALHGDARRARHRRHRAHFNDSLHSAALVNFHLARDRAGDLGCSFEVRKIPPLPDGHFDVVLLFETMLAFADTEPLLREVARALPPGGRFAFTLEEGAPLSDVERERMPDADTVWLTPLDQMLALLGRAGFSVTWQLEVSESHSATAASLIQAFTEDHDAIATAIGREAIDELIAGHQLWREWLNQGRVRKFDLVCVREPVTR